MLALTITFSICVLLDSLGRKLLPFPWCCEALSRPIHPSRVSSSKTRDTLQITIKQLTDKGLGISNQESNPILVPNMLPGEQGIIQFQKGTHISTKSQQVARHGKVVELTGRPSKYRVGPPCALVDRCGGCQIQHMLYDYQLQFKRSNVRDALSDNTSTAYLSSLVEEVLPSAHLSYRNKAQFAIQRIRNVQYRSGSGVKTKNRKKTKPTRVVRDKIAIGLYSSNSNQVVDTNHCAIQHDLVNQALKRLREFLFARSGQVSVYDAASGQGALRHVVLRTGFASKQVMICLVTSEARLPYEHDLVAYLRETMPQVKSILLHHNDLPGDQLIVADDAANPCRTRTLFGSDHITDTIAGVDMKISLQSFVQSNPVQAGNLYGTVLEMIDASRQNITKKSLTLEESSNVRQERTTVWDLYCGVGSIGLYISKQASAKTPPVNPDSPPPLTTTRTHSSRSGSDGASSQYDAYDNIHGTQALSAGWLSRVIGVESCLPAVLDARENAAINNLKNIEFIHAPAELFIQNAISAGTPTTNTPDSYLLSQSSDNHYPNTTDTDTSVDENALQFEPETQTSPLITSTGTGTSNAALMQPQDVVIINPPRRGCHTDLLHTLIDHCKATTLIYVSCNPKTLARDLNVLTNPTNGYRVTRIKPIDMFPQTVHVEVVVLLERK